MSWEFLPQINATSIFTGGTLGVVLIALIKTWPIWQLQVLKAKEKLREEKRSDLSECKQEIAGLRSELDRVTELVTNLKIEMNAVLSAYRVLEVAEHARDPNSAHLATARAILSTAFAIAPSTAGMPKKSSTLAAAEETCAAAEVTKENVERDEAGRERPK
jgi:hypothetical protein